MRVLISGSTGLIGTALVPYLEREGHQVSRLVRRAPTTQGEIEWDPSAGVLDPGAVEGHDAVVHLAGAGIGDKRWTDSHKQRVLTSRVDGTTLLARTLASLDRKPQLLASGSAIGYYGDGGDAELTESSPRGTGFLADICTAWEGATAPAESAGIRTVHLRTGIVLTPKGGALKKLLAPFKAGVGGRQGSGRQWMSWISLDDEVAALAHLIGDTSLRGAVNLTAPNPVTNEEFAHSLGRALHRPSVLPLPGVALKALLGSQMATELLLQGQRVRPTALLSSGFLHIHPTLDGALAALLDRSGATR